MKSISTIARVQKHPSWLIQDLFSIPAMTGFSKYLIWQPFQNIWDFVVVESCLTTKNMKHNLQVATLQLDLLFSFGLHRTRLLQTSILISPDSTFHTENFTPLHFTVHQVCIHYTIHYTSLYTLHSTPLHSASSMHPLHIPESKQANKPLDCRQSSTGKKSYN